MKNDMNMDGHTISKRDMNGLKIVKMDINMGTERLSCIAT